VPKLINDGNSTDSAATPYTFSSASAIYS